MQMVCDRLDVDVAVEAEMADRDQDRILDAREPDLLGVIVADRLMAGHEGKDVVHELAKVAVGAGVQQFGTGHRQRQPAPRLERLSTTRRLAALSFDFLARQGCSPDGRRVPKSVGANRASEEISTMS